jgi:hypothetical protein
MSSQPAKTREPFRTGRLACPECQSYEVEVVKQGGFSPLYRCVLCGRVWIDPSLARAEHLRPADRTATYRTRVTQPGTTLAPARHAPAAAVPQRVERRQRCRDSVAEPPRTLLNQRILGTYREMPGLTLSDAEAIRFFGLSEALCHMLLDDLVRQRHLHRCSDGRYVLPHAH